MFPNPLMSDEEPPLDEAALDIANDAPLTITLLKQHTYCARVVYYETCTPDVRPRTYKMLAGEAAHQRERERAARRTLFAYQIKDGERRFDVRLTSPNLGLTGIIDEVVLMADQALVVDYKLAEWVGENHQLQLTAYALLVEEAFQLPVKQGFVYLMKAKRFESVPVTPQFRNSVLEAIREIEIIRQREYLPPPTSQARKCESCEFRRFCSDL